MKIRFFLFLVSCVSLFENINAATLVQEKRASTNALVSTTSIIPFHTSRPQASQGTPVLQVSITPQNAANILKVQAYLHGASTAISNEWVSAALFVDGDSNALSAASYKIPAANPLYFSNTIPLNYYMVAGTTSPLTFTIRIGTDRGSLLDLNGNGNSQPIFGGASFSSLIVSKLQIRGNYDKEKFNDNFFGIVRIVLGVHEMVSRG